MRPDPTVRRLSPREQQVALLVAAGLKNTVIARRLGLKPGYVSMCIQRIKARLKLDRRADIAAWVAARRSSEYPGRQLGRADPERVGPPAGSTDARP